MSRSRRNVNVQAPTGSQLASIVTSGEQPTTMSSVNTTDVVESELLECETKWERQDATVCINYPIFGETYVGNKTKEVFGGGVAKPVADGIPQS